MNIATDQIITAPVSQFCQVTGIGRTRLYELLNDGSLDSILVGKRRLIILDSYRSLIERQRGAPKHAMAHSAPSRKRAGG